MTMPAFLKGVLVTTLAFIVSTTHGEPQGAASANDSAALQYPMPGGGGGNQLSMRLYTHNIRYNATTLFPGEAPWQTRRPRLVNEVRFNTFHPPEAMVCFQEVLNNQLLDILTDLNQGNTTHEWAYIGVGRDDGKTAGEYSPLFYRPDVWRLDDFRTVWLSPTPDKPSIGWDAGSIRILTIGVFTHRQLRRQIVGMCTHLDNVGSVSRLNSAKIIINRIQNYTGILNGTKPCKPVFLGGDFNSETNQEAYIEMSKPYSPVTDLRLSVPPSQRYGNNNTFTDFTNTTSDDILIDFIWIGPKNTSDWAVKTYGVLANKFDDGVYDSDHRAVIGDAILHFP